jgi:hypothetical protein
MFELIPSDINGTRAALSRLPALLDANVFGDSLHVRIEDEREIETIRKTLETKEIKIYSLKRIEPSMEDVFLSLIPRRASTDEPSHGKTIAK